MYRILTSSSDTYITNKIINNNFRVTDANVGQAASIDLFKLYAESVSGSDASPIEISRALIKFDLEPLRALTGSILDISSSNSSFKCILKLYDVYGGQTCPSNFKLIVFPLSKSFDEGIGRDIVTFADLDACNFITASVSANSASRWDDEGANAQGLLGSRDIDIISSGNLNDGNGVVNLWKDQLFSTGDEDLSVDVTTIISATLKNLIPDNGLRISYSGSQETDKITRFVKRFGSSQNSNFYKKPKLIVKFNDTIQDHHESFYFNISGSLFLNNFHRGFPANILSGASATQIAGSNSIVLKLASGSKSRGTYFEKVITGSQHSVGNLLVSGVYSASFALSQFTGSNSGEIRFNGALENEIKNAGSATFKEIWSSLDDTVGFLTGSLVVNSVNRTSFKNNSPRILITVTNMQQEYRKGAKVRFNVFAENIDRTVKFKKLPIETKSQIFTSLYYRIRDIETGNVIIPFDKSNNSTLCSTDSDSMYFETYTDSLPVGVLCTIDFLLSENGVEQTFTDVSSRFKVV
jgi:hypothetical protein